MDVIKKLLPGANGTRRFTTIELIANAGLLREGPAAARHALEPHPAKHVLVRVACPESLLRQAIKQSGGKWQPERRAWRLPWREVRRLGLQDRVIEP